MLKEEAFIALEIVPKSGSGSISRLPSSHLLAKLGNLESLEVGDFLLLLDFLLFHRLLLNDLLLFLLDGAIQQDIDGLPDGETLVVAGGLLNLADDLVYDSLDVVEQGRDGLPSEENFWG